MDSISQKLIVVIWATLVLETHFLGCRHSLGSMCIWLVSSPLSHNRNQIKVSSSIMIYEGPCYISILTYAHRSTLPFWELCMPNLNLSFCISNYFKCSNQRALDIWHPYSRKLGFKFVYKLNLYIC